jgi:hypothetical protein
VLFALASTGRATKACSAVDRAVRRPALFRGNRATFAPLTDPGWAGALAQDLSLPHAGKNFGQRRHLLASLPRDKSGGAKNSS